MEPVSAGDSSKGFSPPRYAYVDRNGKTIIDAGKYRAVGSFSEGMAAVWSPSQRWGYIDKSGKHVIEPQFEFARAFSEGLASVCIGGRWGYIDKKGTVVIEPQYESANSFSQGIAVVTKGDPPPAPHVPEKTQGIVITRQILVMRAQTVSLLQHEKPLDDNRQVLLIDRAGKTILSPDKAEIEFSLDDPDRFSEGVILVYDCAAKKYGFIDKTGRFEIQPQFTEAGPFSEGLARVAVEQDGEEKLAFIDHDGEFVIAPKFNTDADFRRNSTDFSEGLASVTEGLRPTLTHEEKFVYIDKKSSIVLFTDFFYAGRFSEGRASVYDADKDKWGYIEKSGKLAIPLQYQLASDFSEGLAVVAF